MGAAIVGGWWLLAVSLPDNNNNNKNNSSDSNYISSQHAWLLWWFVYNHSQILILNFRESSKNVLFRKYGWIENFKKVGFMKSRFYEKYILRKTILNSCIRIVILCILWKLSSTANYLLPFLFFFLLEVNLPHSTSLYVVWWKKFLNGSFLNNSHLFFPIFENLINFKK